MVFVRAYRAALLPHYHALPGMVGVHNVQGPNWLGRCPPQASPSAALEAIAAFVFDF